MRPSTVSSLSLPERKSSALTIMKEIDGDWIHKQKLQSKSMCHTPKLLPHHCSQTPPTLLLPNSSHITLCLPTHPLFVDGIIGPSPSSSKSHRPNSIAVMEGLNPREESPTSCWLCLKDQCRRKSWSRVLGESRTRSVDTGLNELDRITGQSCLMD